MNKVIVIGLDGATFDLIDPWIEEGKLPVLAGLIKKGTHGLLRSTPLSNSAQAWSSFITGKNPGKHGIYDFFESLSDSYGVRFLNASFRKGKSLWRLVGDAGKKVGVMNVPITYPAEKVNGFLISGLDSPGMNAQFAYPPDLMDEIGGRVGKYILEPGIWGYIRRGKPDTALAQLIEMVKTRTATAKYLLENKDWDLFMVVYTATDKVQHHFWKYIDPARPESRSTEPHKDAILNVYEEIDRGLGELLQVAGDASVIVMSDHGAGPSSRRTMYINRWLHKEGFLCFTDDTGIPGRVGRLKYALLEKTSNRIKRLFPRRAKEILLRLFPRLRDRVDSVLSLPGIDWSRTVAYSRENHPAIFINRVGREPRGIVRSGQQYEDVKNQIIDKLGRLTCPETGRPIVGRTFAFDELFHGPEAEKAPDIVFEWNDSLYVHRPSGSGANTDFLETLDDKTLLASENDIRPSGIHRDDGIFVGFGSHFKEGNTIRGARIYDVAPTVLYLLGIPIPDDMDGEVLEDAIVEDCFKLHPVEQSVMASDAPDPQATVDFTEDESRDVEERLRGLGYID